MTVSLSLSLYMSSLCFFILICNHVVYQLFLSMRRIYRNANHLPQRTYILTVTSMFCSCMCEDIFIFFVFWWVLKGSRLLSNSPLLSSKPHTFHLRFSGGFRIVDMAQNVPFLFSIWWNLWFFFLRGRLIGVNNCVIVAVLEVSWCCYVDDSHVCTVKLSSPWFPLPFLLFEFANGHGIIGKHGNRNPEKWNKSPSLAFLFNIIFHIINKYLGDWTWYSDVFICLIARQFVLRFY